jgi:predicted TIM-barrel fold metal-dependent hydrolase
MRLAALLLSLACLSSTSAQQTLSFEEYEPKSSLVVPQNLRPKAKFPFIDIHNHQNRNPDLDRLVSEMDKLNLQVMVNLSGGFGEFLKDNVQYMKEKYAKRFVVFANLDFSRNDEPDYPARIARQLETDVRNGAQGLKLFKNFGMEVRDSKGSRIPVDDPRFDPAFQTAGRLKIPVLIHTADPHQFWEPMDKYNERWLELKLRSGRARNDGRTPPFEQLIAEQHRLFAKHPKTTFINAHLGWLGGDLTRLGQLLDRYPNVVTELGAVIAELGRQPRAARAFLIKYQDRVLIGKDSWAPSEDPTYFRVLETADEYFDYYRKYHAFWKMYGLDLPDPVLKKIYYQNALRIVPGIDASQFPK